MLNDPLLRTATRHALAGTVRHIIRTTSSLLKPADPLLDCKRRLLQADECPDFANSGGVACVAVRDTWCGRRTKPLLLGGREEGL
jgi:hypothetical protein